MKVFFVFLLVLVFGVVSSHGRTHEDNAPTPFKTSTTINHDEFFLVQQWPASYCRALVEPNKPCRLNIPKYFTVHGLWAQLNGDPAYCKGVKGFNISKLNHNTKSNLITYWPNLNGQDPEFWRYEYDRHASCISPFQNDQENYFSSTLKLAKKYNVTTMLLKAGIQPGLKQYSISDIKNATFRAINFTATLQCNKAKDGTVQLFQIYLCFDKTASKLQNCTKPYKNCPTQNNGNSQISFPLPGS